MMKCWMVRKRSTGLYSCAGSSPYFKKRGKVFYRYGDLVKHLAYFQKYRSGTRANPYADCEIVEFDMNEISTKDVFVEIGIIEL